MEVWFRYEEEILEEDLQEMVEEEEALLHELHLDQEC